MTAAPAAPVTSPAPSPAARQGSVTNEIHFGGGTDAPEPTQGDSDSELFKGLDDLGNEPSKETQPPPKSATNKEAPKTDAAKSEKGELESKKVEEDDEDDFLNPAATKGEKKAEAPKKPEEAATDDAKAGSEAEGKVSGIKQLRSEYEKTKGELSTLSKSIAAKEKEISDLRTQLSAHDYTQSEDYIQKYDKPLRDAVNYAAKELQGFQVYDNAGNPRPVNYGADFAPLLNASLPRDQVVKMATEKFGDMAPEILALRRDIMQAHQRKMEATNDFRQRSEQIRQEQQERSIKQREQIRTKFNDLREEMKGDARYKGLFNPGDDAKAKKLLEDGEALVSQAFEPPADMPVDQILKLRAAAANRIAVAGVLQRKVKQMEQEIATLKKYRESTPGLGDGTRGSSAVTDDPIESLDKWADR